MPSSNLLLLTLLFGLAEGSSTQKYPLPASATIHLGPTGEDASSPDAQTCRGFHLTAKQVRSRFATYHALKPVEDHDYYAYFPCWSSGTIILNGKSFDFKARPGNTILTTYPDAKEKLLGGKHTDDPSGTIR